MTEESIEPIPAATVILARDAGEGIEVLMLRRSSRGAFGGMWVFPGGKVENDDIDPADPGDELGAARRAAVREAEEEAAVVVDGDALVTFSHWLPPPVAPKRFSTWFFLAPAPEAIEVAVDNAEIRDHEWLRPVDAIARRDAGEIELAPPTWVTLWRLSGVATVDEAVRLAQESEPQRFETHVYMPDGVPVAVWHDDIAYDSGDLHQPGPRHRLWRLSGVATVDEAVRLAQESEPQRFETHVYMPDGVPVAVWHDDIAYDSGDLHQPGPRHRLWMLPDGWSYEAT